MDRRSFLLKSSVAGVGLTLIPSLVLRAQSDTELKLELLNALKLYAKDHLELDVKRSFFSKWSQDESMHYYLYVSLPDKVSAPDGMKDFEYFGSSKEAATLQQKKYVDQGFHTLLYKRSGADDYTITNSLLGFSPESMALLLFHAAAHQHLGKHAKLSLPIEEAVCEVLGVFGAQFFAERKGSVEEKGVKRLTKTIERSYKLINETIPQVSTDVVQNDKLYRKIEQKLFNDFYNADAFIQQRFIHPVNNAYLLKNQYFAKYYTLIKALAEKDKFIGTFLYNIERLPKAEDEAIEQVKKLLNAK